MRRAQSKYCYWTDTFPFSHTSEVTKRLNNLYSDPEAREVISVNIFQNGNEFNAMIVSRKLKNKE